jgi:hypothetical protein
VQDAFSRRRCVPRDRPVSRGAHPGDPDGHVRVDTVTTPNVKTLLLLSLPFLQPIPLPGPSVSFGDYQTDDRRSPCSLIDLMTLFGRLSSFFRNSGSRDGSECNVMPTYSESVASIACAWFTGPCLSKDLRSRGEVASTQPFALTWRGCPHCHAPLDRQTIKCHFRKQPKSER